MRSTNTYSTRCAIAGKLVGNKTFPFFKLSPKLRNRIYKDFLSIQIIRVDKYNEYKGYKDA